MNPSVRRTSTKLGMISPWEPKTAGFTIRVRNPSIITRPIALWMQAVVILLMVLFIVITRQETMPLTPCIHICPCLITLITEATKIRWETTLIITILTPRVDLRAVFWPHGDTCPREHNPMYRPVRMENRLLPLWIPILKRGRRNRAKGLRV